MVKVAQGLKEDGVLVVSTSKGEQEIRALTGYGGRLAMVNANRISIEVIGRAITNMVMLGAFVRATGLIDAAGIEATIAERFGGMLGRKNVEALRRAVAETVIAGGKKEAP
jgi:2-oxoacid:acceptor oxidoreductase gamma subunit (pyruvate/2-ketoisovalerate family)